ncbi:MAG: hypothetical protein HY868_05220 [Chloroflexi bacterium]|nr:hypothetical protein [Chloroflexota bacterium]
MTTTFDYDSLGRITRRYTSLGYSDYTYEDGTNWLIRETWHSAISGNIFTITPSVEIPLSSALSASQR